MIVLSFSFSVRMKEGERVRWTMEARAKVRSRTQRSDGRGRVLISLWNKFECGARSKSPSQYSITPLSEASYSNVLNTRSYLDSRVP